MALRRTRICGGNPFANVSADQIAELERKAGFTLTTAQLNDVAKKNFLRTREPQKLYMNGMIDNQASFGLGSAPASQQQSE